MLFCQKRVTLKITGPKLALTAQKVLCSFPEKRVELKLSQKYRSEYTGYNAISPKKSKTENHPVKGSVINTQGTMLFCQERVRLEIGLAKFRVNGTAGTVLFSYGKVRLKITKSKIPLRGQNSIIRTNSKTNNYLV